MNSRNPSRNWFFRMGSEVAKAAMITWRHSVISNQDIHEITMITFECWLFFSYGVRYPEHNPGTIMLSLFQKTSPHYDIMICMQTLSELGVPMLPQSIESTMVNNHTEQTLQSLYVCSINFEWIITFRPVKSAQTINSSLVEISPIRK